MSAAAQSLIHPFDAGLLDPPGAGRGFFLRAEIPDGEWVRALACEQTFKPGCEALRRAGFRVGNELGQDGGFDVGLCLLSKHKIENFANIARGWSLLRPGGLLVCAGANDTGAGSVAREVKAVLGEIDSLSKHHCKVFWFRRAEGPVPEKLVAWERAGRLQRVEAIGG
ncbi:MAG: class I SAM-dependent methyltransferase, partial [Rhodospirillales bacterium]|nr:class I SAM-dependent methyltransferase [Rhodospirillales bacterium]